MPWYIGSEIKIRPASSKDIKDGTESIARLLELLPNLKAIALVGQKAQQTKNLITALRPKLPIFNCPHPSPLFVNNKPENREILLESLREISKFLDEGQIEEPPTCPFCRSDSDRLVQTGKATIAFYDGFPISPGHTLVIPKRHVRSIFDLDGDELKEVWGMVSTVRELLKASHRPAGFNIGVNDGESAGQTIGHAHIHVIPRYDGDLPDPRGGVRWIIPDKAKYW